MIARFFLMDASPPVAKVAHHNLECAGFCSTSRKSSVTSTETQACLQQMDLVLFCRKRPESLGFSTLRGAPAPPAVAAD
jgi:hypothetical protein